MPVIPEFQAPIDELNASAAAIAAVVADLKAQAANAPAQGDISDTLAAVQAGADAVKAAVGA